MRTGDTGKDVLIEKEALPDVLDGVIHFDANDQATSAHIPDVGQPFEFAHEVIADEGGVVDESFLLQDIEDGDSGGTGEVIAAEGGTEHA